MKNVNITHPLLLLLLLPCVGVLMAWCFMLHRWMAGSMLAAALLIILSLIISLFHRQTRKIAFMFDALENEDFTFRFQVNYGSKNDRLMNQSLNRIRDLIATNIQMGREREQYYEVILESAAGGVVVIDDRGSIYQCNRAARLIFGLNIFTHVFQLGQLDARIPSVLTSMHTGENRTISFYNERSKRTISLLCSEFNAQEKSLKIISITDISSSIEGAEVESWQRLSRVLTHEIMNSLAPITSLSEALLECEGNDVRHGLEVINSTSRSLIHFVENYRTLTHIPAPNCTDFALDAMLAEVVQLFDTGVTLLPYTTPLVVNSDENLLRGVIINLVRNGLQAGGEVALTVTQESVRTVIEVSDTGCGISEQIAQNMYIPFFTTKDGGSGIGLSLARQVILSLGGSLLLLPSPKESPRTIFQVTLRK